MSFKENFTRDESKDDVQYDDSAFYTFGGTMLMCVILPITYVIYKRIFVKNDFCNTNLKNCSCSFCRQKMQDIYTLKKQKAKNKTFYFLILALVALCYLTYNCYFQIKANSGNFKTFNPFEILEIEVDATEQQIKKAYKRLALKYHPDRNPNNLQAKAKFMMLTKAYEALTDETGRKNWELYGNPDGPGSMRLAVGLPSFVLNKKNHMPILILFLIFIVVILPAFVFYWFNSSNNYDDAGVQITDHRIFYELLNENILLRQMPFVLGSSIEFSRISVRSAEIDELKKLYKKYAELMPKHKEEVIPMGNKKAICLLYAYLDETTTMTSKTLNADLVKILELSPNLIYTMYQVARQYSFLKDMQEMQMKNMGVQVEQKMIIKNFGIGCIRVIIEFSQILIQKQSFKASPFLQLPYFSENIFKTNKSLNKMKTDLPSFILMPDEDKIEILSENNTFNKQEIEDIIAASNSVPNYKISVEINVEGFEDIVKDDFVTFRFKIVKENLQEGLKNGFIHTNKFPHDAKEKLALILVNNGKVIYETIIEIEDRETTIENKQLMATAGTYRFKFEIHSLNYRGMELGQEIQFEVKNNSEKRKQFMKKLEKAEPKKLEPSLFQQMINQMVVNPEDEEEEESEEESEEENEEEEGEEEEEQEIEVKKAKPKASSGGNKDKKKNNLDKLD